MATEWRCDLSHAHDELFPFPVQVSVFWCACASRLQQCYSVVSIPSRSHVSKPGGQTPAEPRNSAAAGQVPVPGCLLGLLRPANPVQSPGPSPRRFPSRRLQSCLLLQFSSILSRVLAQPQPRILSRVKPGILPRLQELFSRRLSRKSPGKRAAELAQGRRVPSTRLRLRSHVSGEENQEFHV